MRTSHVLTNENSLYSPMWSSIEDRTSLRRRFFFFSHVVPLLRLNGILSRILLFVNFDKYNVINIERNKRYTKNRSKNLLLNCRICINHRFPL